MISNIISLLREILKEIEKDNPYGLIGKGGTILAIYHLNHRDSQDLDFDCLTKNKDKDFETYFKSIFDKVTKEHKLNCRVNKTSFSATGRFHMNVIFSTYKDLPPTKMEVNFIDKLPNDLITLGEMKFYPLEHLFFQKLKATIDRREIKDLIDIGSALKSKEPMLDYKKLETYENILTLIDGAISIIEKLEKNPKEWKEELATTELKFDINEKNFPQFMNKTKTGLHRLKNYFKKKSY
ncbi:nucleotidyl transferase AbiEii/AbiGii toxin family protein [Candidatus Woesearchaeota archaeon]|nr:nucleotidyl transferase AbiEii/AbiGii toxin family protein [Candidatus Woesearchaeota archaeon]